jgi:ubiquinone/menaquinone biosynthesis C-methylase UbiE
MRHHRHHNQPGAFSGRRSRFYNLMARTLLRRVYRRLAADVASIAPTGATVLDIGTGPGVLLVELARRRPDLRVIGIDLSADMVAAAARNLAQFGERARAEVADVTDLPLADDSVDLAVSSLSLHHWDHPEAAVAQLDRVLRAGGRLRVYDFPSAPFDALISEAWNRSLFAGSAPLREPTEIRLPFFPRMQKLTMTAA